MSAPVLERELLTVDEAARVLRVSAKTVYRLLGSGSLPAHRIREHGPLRIDADELEAWLEQNRAPRGSGNPGERASADAGTAECLPAVPAPHLPEGEAA